MSGEIYGHLPKTRGDFRGTLEGTPYIKLRPYEADDAKLILHSWMKSMRGMYRDALDEHYFPGQQARIMKISQQPQTRVTIAADAEKPWYIYGWIVADVPGSDNEPLIVHYCFVKNSFRRQGIGRALMEAVGWYPDRYVYATHWNYYLKELRQRIKIRFNPWLLDS